MDKPTFGTIAARAVVPALLLPGILAPLVLLGCMDATGEILEPDTRPAALPSARPASTGNAPAVPTGSPAAPTGSPAAPDGSPAVPPPAITGTLVPLYTYPTDPSWRALAEGKLAHPSVPVIAVINPDNGPGARASADFATGIEALTTAGVRVIGYVSTAYTERAEAVVRADIDSYRQWYPRTTGIFFDEQTNSPGGEDYYRRLTAYARSQGFTYTVGNPGADTAPSYVGTVDLILVYESAGLPGASSMGGWHTSYDHHNFGIIPYGVSTLDKAFVAEAKGNVGYLYITGDTLPNPWDTLPPYFSQMLAQLAE